MYRSHQEACDNTFLAFNADPSRRLSVAITTGSIKISNAYGPVAAIPFERDPMTLKCSPALTVMPVSESKNIVLAAIEALFAQEPQARNLRLQIARASALRALLLAEGIAIDTGDELTVVPELFWQLQAPWLARQAVSAFPQMQVMTDGKRHPLRPPCPVGVVYARFIPWLHKVLSFRSVEIETDLCRFNRWMNDPRVDEVWDEGGDLNRHRAYLQNRISDPHVLALLGCFDDQPFGYFEVYWAKESRLGPYYDSDDYDRGWHVAVGEPAFRGKAWVSAWLPSLMHFMFLDDPRTQRIVGEPAAAHAQQIRNLERSGFAKIKHFDFPHKRALLVVLLRERYFGDRLWLPNEKESESVIDAASIQSHRIVHRDERAAAL